MATIFILLLNLTSTSALLRASSLSLYNNLDAAVVGCCWTGSFSQTARYQSVTNNNGEAETSSCLSSHDMKPLCDFKSQKCPNQIQNDRFVTSNHNNASMSHNDVDDNDNNRTNKEDHDYSKIRNGEIYVQQNFLNSSQVALLRRDIAQLQQHQPKEIATSRTKRMAFAFKSSGLSNRIAGDRNVFGSSDRLTCTITPDLFKGDEKLSSMRLVVEEKMENLKLQLQVALSPKSKPANHPCTFVDAAAVEDEHRNERLSSSLPVENRERLQADLGPCLELELAEMYYSVSPKGSHLPRHQDERHEETKGNNGWINDTRRSISWLIYLNDDDWGGTIVRKDSNETAYVYHEGNQSAPATAKRTQTTNQSDGSAGHGGELRAYVRKCYSKERVQCGSHDGDIQVGWLRIESSRSPSTAIEYEPIFLDSWIKTRSSKSNNEEKERDEEELYYDDSLEWQALSALYRIRRKDLSPETKDNLKELVYDDPQKPLREYLSPPFGPNSPSWPSEQNLEPTDFARALALQLTSEDHQRRFVGIEVVNTATGTGDDGSMCDLLDIVDVVPTGGTLVLFDSVTVPHEVLEVTMGKRLAIAGWYHERQQDFPEWYGT